MKRLFVLLCALLVLTACSWAKNLVNAYFNQELHYYLRLVKENHAEMTKDGKTYLLDTYLRVDGLDNPRHKESDPLRFEPGYRVYIRTKDGSEMDSKVAQQLVKEYILPRACQGPLESEPHEYFNTVEGNRLLFEVEC